VSTQICLFILLKSNPLGAVAIGSGLRILRFPAAASRGIYHLFCLSLKGLESRFSSTLSRLSRCRCAVSVGAHYREPELLCKGFLKEKLNLLADCRNPVQLHSLPTN
ncbi:hypothetical protein, partial [Shewanella algae]|uniref:hypothetical protein n=1 Tax=Shewanella algae TaxID=38313 RepID=UPI001E5AAB3E